MFSFRKSPNRHKILWLTSPDHIAQAILILIPAWFGLTLFSKPNIFETSRSYFYIQQQMNEFQWAALSTSIAFISVICWAAHNRYAMIFQNCLLMGWHGLVALCIFIANPITPGSGTYAILAFAATMRALNLSISTDSDWR